jgi:hypothetical protein
LASDLDLGRKRLKFYGEVRKKKMARQKKEPEVLDPELTISEAERLPVPKLVPQPAELMLMPVMDLEVAKARLKEFQLFVSDYMKKDEDYGLIPGVEKPSLFQPGADKLSELYGLAPTFPDERTIRNVDWSMVPALFDYEVTCVLVSKRTGMVVAEGKGSCSSYEAKYRWRDSKRKCPLCNQETIIKGKEEYGGGYLCWTKRGGCGAKFGDGNKEIEGQVIGRVPNDDIADIKNTILKMAQKRAKIAAVLAATRSSGVFTQDVEDMAGFGNGSEPQAAAVSDGIIIKGFIENKVPINGALWVMVGDRRCMSRDEKLKQRLDNVTEEEVELLVKPKKTSKSEEFFEVKEILKVVVQEDIPF